MSYDRLEQVDVTEKAKEPKHIELNDAINYIDSAIRNARYLLEQIRGNAEEEKAISNIAQTPSLVDILIGGPGEIRNKTNELNDIIYEIKNTLF
jgi:hypothetical protein